MPKDLSKNLFYRDKKYARNTLWEQIMMNNIENGLLQYHGGSYNDWCICEDDYEQDYDDIDECWIEDDGI